LTHYRRTLTLLVPLLVVPLLIVAAILRLSAWAADPVRGGRLNVAIRVNPSSLDPVLARSGDDRHTLFQLNEGLVALDEKLSIVPALAESWSIPDPRTIVFKLRRGVKFHDGTDFNARAVQQHFDRLRDPATKSPWGSDYKEIEAIVVVDDFTVKFALKAPSAPLLANLADMGGLIPSPAAIEKFGKDYGRHPVGTGLFQFVEWVQDDHLLLRRNQQYREHGLPYLDEVFIRFIPDDTVKVTSLRSGDVDLIDFAPPRDAAALKADPSVRYVVTPGLGYLHLQLNAEKPPFNNKALRQAVALAIDREAIGKVIYFGTGVPPKGPIPPIFGAFYGSGTPGSGRDLGKAKSKLAEAGMPNGFSFTYLNRNDGVMPELAQLIQGQLAEVGIKATIDMLDINQQLVELREGRYQAAPRTNPGRADVDGNFTRFFHSKGGINYGRYKNPEADRLMDLGAATYDTAKRIGIYRELEKIVVDDAPTVFLYHYAQDKAMSKKAQGFRAIPDGMLRFKTMWKEK
jgi:peptide/nickel transport system substrate-binding protein